jgi:hypothetical protein
MNSIFVEFYFTFRMIDITSNNFYSYLPTSVLGLLKQDDISV